MMHPYLNRFLLPRFHGFFVQANHIRAEACVRGIGGIIQAVFVSGKRFTIRHPVQVLPALAAGQAVEEHRKLPSFHAVPVGRGHNISQRVPFRSGRDSLRHIILIPLLHIGIVPFRGEQLAGLVLHAIEDERHTGIHVGIP